MSGTGDVAEQAVPISAVVALNLELATDDGELFRFDEVEAAIHQADPSLAAYLSPGIGKESEALDVNPLLHIDLYSSDNLGSSLTEFLLRVEGLVERLLQAFRQRAVGYSLLLTDGSSSWRHTGVISADNPWNLSDLTEVPHHGDDLRVVHRVLFVALRRGSEGHRGNEMLFYPSKDWKSVALVPAPEIAEDHPDAQDATFVKQIMLARIGLDARDWPGIEVRSLAGIKSSTIKPSWDDFKALRGQLARYEFRVAWCELPAEACARFKAYDALTADDRAHETPGFATLKAVRSVARNTAANWDVYDCVERHFGGHLLCIQPNP